MKNPNLYLNKISIVILVVFTFLAGYSLRGYKNLSADLSSLSQKAATSSVSTSSTSGNDNATSTLALNAVSQCISEPPKNVDYKLIENVDECLLNKLSKDGWHIFQNGYSR